MIQYRSSSLIKCSLFASTTTLSKPEDEIEHDDPPDSVH